MNLECNTAVEPSSIRSPMCRKKLAVLTRVFLQQNVWRFLPDGQKKVAVIMWLYYQGDRKASFTVLISPVNSVKSYIPGCLIYQHFNLTFQRKHTQTEGLKPSSDILHPLLTTRLKHRIYTLSVWCRKRPPTYQDNLKTWLWLSVYLGLNLLEKITTNSCLTVRNYLGKIFYLIQPGHKLKKPLLKLNLSPCCTRRANSGHFVSYIAKENDLRCTSG